ncbi:glycine betaine ABC transporter substrate-binding protein [Microlunatus soli]|uniref:Osmoprotectant transport system substrate-binding protein n=1 Tax=Microlunatus soli TaxID=630515 RepID=A0A1H1UJ56_9ACTN|nr:glycine betaine ABC transporter substrate-binding protein [Microlunatus soli]SDS72528.1 osmoprotectant transport system substrate-binding protein [Microlunatus soli]
MILDKLRTKINKTGLTKTKINKNGSDSAVPTKVIAGGLAGVLLAGLSACGLGTASGIVPSGELAGPLQGKSLKGATLNVGSKNFTEQLILGKMTGILMKSAGATVNDFTNIPGSASARQAELAGNVDVMWEYTGTAWASYFQEDKPVRDPHKQYVVVRDRDLKQNKLVWLPPSPMNNTYGFAAPKAKAEKLGVTSLSDLKKIPVKERTFCIESEFASRNDGFQPMLKAYGLKYGSDVPKSNVKTFDTGAIYSATAQGECNFGEVFTTDGRIKALNLKVMTDDKRFFPNYNVCSVWRQEILQKYPQIKDIIEPVAAKLDDETLTDLNGKVDVEGQTPATVAEDWLRKEGFIR